MNILKRQFRRLFYGIALSAYVAAPVMAADIEIFTDSNSAATTAQPNVMFIMDSSDPMRSEDLDSGPTVAPYEPTTTYPTVNSFDSTRLYYKADGVAPTTHSDSETFDSSAYHCDHAYVDYQPNDTTTGYISQETETIYTEGVNFEIYKVVTVTALGDGEQRKVDVETFFNNNTDDTADDVKLSSTTLSSFNTGEDVTLGVLSTETDLSSQFTYSLRTVVTISGVGTGLIDSAKGGARQFNVKMDYDQLNDGSYSYAVADTNDEIEAGYGPLLSVGFYSGQMAHVKPGNNPGQAVTWRALDTNQNAERAYSVECKQDQGLHGHNTSSTTSETHIVTENGKLSTDGWGTSEDASLIASLWSEASDNFYTVYHPNYLNYLQQATPTTTSGVSMFQMLKNAIETIVASASNINIGIMQFDRNLNNSSSHSSTDGLWVDSDGDSVIDNGEQDDISDNSVANPGTNPNTGITGGEGAGVQYPAIDVNASRQNFYSNLKTMDASGDAPLSETYYEALKYFGGEAIDYGSGANPPNSTGTKENGNPSYYASPITDSCQKNYIIIISGGQSRYDFVPKAKRETLFGFNANSCGNTGGVDSTHYGAGFDDGSLPGNTATAATRLSNSNLSAFASDTATDDNCLDEFAEWAFTDDIARRDETGPSGQANDGSDLADTHAGEQNIITYTVGFAFPATATAEQAAAEQLLKDTAEKGGGEFIEAADEDALVAALNEMLTTILKVNSTFSSPAVSVNAFNRSTHLNDLYFTLFKPDDHEHWTGNLKKYKLDFDDDNQPFIADKNGIEAVNETTGFFNENAQSYWSAAVDGDEAGDGGAANLVGNTAADGAIPVRKVYTITGSYTNGSGRTDGVMVPAVQDLTDGENLFSSTNANLTNAQWDTLLAVDSTTHLQVVTGEAYAYSLIDWANGKDIFDEVSGSDSRRVMGDPLHAEPALVQYGQLSVDADNNGEDDPDLVSYMATNDGYLHAIDSRDQSPNDSPASTGGTELWAFIPKEFLPNLDPLLEDDGSEGKMYGIDGSVVPWIHDANGDGVITENVSHTYPDDDHAYIYFGMRRGLENLQTRNYIYALDVTDRTQPKFMWMIEAGTGAYDELGQTWSNINVETIRVDDEERTVLMFGGGYDLGQDSVTVRTADSMGRAIYIVDAQTGERLWSAGPPNADVAITDHDLQLSNMLYSIPSRLKPLDISGDGIIDRIYVGDMGGQLWRFDITQGTAATKAAASGVSDELTDLITGGRLAELAEDSDITANRRFFYPPDVAFIVEEGQGAYLSVLAASGNRAHPLQTDTHDRMYMIRDKNIYDPPPDIAGDGVDTSDYEAIMVTDTAASTDLHDATQNLVTEGTDAERTAAVDELANRQGWFIDFSEPDDSSWVGEKALSEPLIFSNVAILSTYLPASAGYVSAALCEPNAGTAARYFINIADGTPTYSSDDELGVRGDRRQLLKRGGIPPTPSVIITEDGTPTLCIGTECDSATTDLNITKTYWYEIEATATLSP